MRGASEHRGRGSRQVDAPIHIVEVVFVRGFEIPRAQAGQHGLVFYVPDFGATPPCEEDCRRHDDNQRCNEYSNGNKNSFHVSCSCQAGIVPALDM